MTDPLNRNAGARMMARMLDMERDLTERLAQADEALASLRAVASTAVAAIAASKTDRAALHAALDDLGKRVSDVEKRLTVGVTAKT